MTGIPPPHARRERTRNLSPWPEICGRFLERFSSDLRVRSHARWLFFQMKKAVWEDDFPHND
jgi:hypothetical protein